jgi:hypothetical protein
VLGDDTSVNVDKGNTPLGKGYDVLAVSSICCTLAYIHRQCLQCVARATGVVQDTALIVQLA